MIVPNLSQYQDVSEKIQFVRYLNVDGVNKFVQPIDLPFGESRLNGEVVSDVSIEMIVDLAALYTFEERCCRSRGTWPRCRDLYN